MTIRLSCSPTLFASAILAACLASPLANAATMAKPDYSASSVNSQPPTMAFSEASLIITVGPGCRPRSAN